MVPKYKLFCFRGNGSDTQITIHNKVFDTVVLYNLLRQYGLTNQTPAYVECDKTERICWNAFDNGPHAWLNFNWRGTQCSLGFSYHFYIRVYDMIPDQAERVINEIQQEMLLHWKSPVPSQQFIIYVARPNGQSWQWHQLATRRLRAMETIYMSSNHKETLIKQLDKFYQSQDLYDKFCVTWKRVHLFHGPPGSGKTSTVIALASMFGKNLAKLTITPDVNSRALETLFQSVPDNSFLLLEDVDALFTERQALGSVDFSTILNCMDGVTTSAD